MALMNVEPVTAASIDTAHQKHIYIYKYDPSPCSFIFLYVHHLPCRGSKAGTVMCGVLGVRLRPEEDLSVNHSSEEFPMLTVKHQEQQKLQMSSTRAHLLETISAHFEKNTPSKQQQEHETRVSPICEA